MGEWIHTRPELLLIVDSAAIFLVHASTGKSSRQLTKPAVLLMHGSEDMRNPGHSFKQRTLGNHGPSENPEGRVGKPRTKIGHGFNIPAIRRLDCMPEHDGSLFMK
nr:hypothetical protein CFP56_38872 [Quercus suber]